MKKQEDVKVSVIIPIYNAAEFLRECLDSVLAQTLGSFEVICVDDGSADNSVEILQDYARRDKRIIIVEQENQGAGAARNNGMALARGEYLSFLDSDDIFEKSMLQSAYEASIECDADVCVFDADLFDHSTGAFRACTWAFRRQFFPENMPFSPRSSEVRDNIFRMFNGWPWDKLFKRSYIASLNLKYQNLRTTNDMFFVYIALAMANRIVTVDKVLAHQRVNVKTSLSRTREKSWNCFYTALVAMQEELKKYGVYNTLEKAFVNWAINFSLWQLNTMKGDVFEKTYNLLKYEGFERLDITRHDRSYFYNEKEYNQFVRIFTLPLEKYFTSEG